MGRDWRDITDDELLNFDGPQTAEIARYDRIMRKKNIDALMQVWAGLFDVKKSLHSVGDKIEARLLESEKFAKATAASQSRLQWAAIALTVVIAVSTIVYTWITWQSVQAQREANQIQRESRAFEVKPGSQASSPALTNAPAR